MNAKFSLAAILSTVVIASSLVLAASRIAQSCSLSRYRYHTFTEETSQANWLHSSWSAIVTLPGIALAVSLYVSGRSIERQ